MLSRIISLMPSCGLTKVFERCKIQNGVEMTDRSDFVVIKIVQGELNANILKSHLESEGIPVYLKYESAGLIYGITVDGIGEVRILVPADLEDEARKIIEPVEFPNPEEE
jgi:hypothetical protein